MSEVHDGQRLKELQALPLERKIGITAARITEFVSKLDGKVYVSYSGGLDSEVLLCLVRKLYPNVPAVFIDTGLEYPEIKTHVATHPNVTAIKPALTFVDVIKKVGYPVVSKEVSHTIYHARRGAEYMLKKLRGECVRKDGTPSMFNYEKWMPLLHSDFDISDHCCDEMKKKPARKYEKQTGRKPMIGTLAEDSLLRKQKWIKHGCNSLEAGKEFSTPMSFWTRQDVLQYAKLMGLAVCSVYGDIVQDENGEYKTTGVHNTGCLFCMFGAHHKNDNRFSELQRTHPNIYNWCMGGGKYENGKWVPHQGLGLAHVMDAVLQVANYREAQK